MGKRVVVGLDSSEYGSAAVEVACRRTKLYEGVVVGLAVVDRPGIEQSEAATPIGAGQFARRAIAHHLSEAHARADELLERFEEHCGALGVECETVKKEGRPRQCLREEGMSADLVVVGTRTYSKFGADPEEDDPGHTLQRLLRSRTVPVVAVPKKPPEVRRVIFPFDGAPEAARAMRMFTYQTPQSEIHHPVTLLHVCDDCEEGTRLLVPPTRYLEAHGRNVDIRIESGPVHDTVLQVCKSLQPALVVLGASSKGAFEELVFGSVAKALIADGSLLLFIAA
jgi:nucleotide-binding universal stress UspA family protein